MADNKTKRPPEDVLLISLTEDYEVLYWAKRFGVSRRRLIEAVKAVGNSSTKVGEYLKR